MKILKVTDSEVVLDLLTDEVDKHRLSHLEMVWREVPWSIALYEGQLVAKVRFPLEDPIDALGFSGRTYNALRNGGVSTIGDLLRKTEGDLLSMRGMGRTSVREIRSILATYHLEIRP